MPIYCCRLSKEQSQMLLIFIQCYSPLFLLKFIKVDMFFYLIAFFFKLLGNISLLSIRLDHLQRMKSRSVCMTSTSATALQVDVRLKGICKLSQPSFFPSFKYILLAFQPYPVIFCKTQTDWFHTLNLNTKMCIHQTLEIHDILKLFSRINFMFQTSVRRT